MSETTGDGHHQHGPPPTEPADPARSHGMAVIGEQSVYCSHLPMFMAAHDYQVIAEVEFEGQPDVRRLYLDDRAKHPDQRLYTFEPKPFVLPDLFPTVAGPARLTTFVGKLHRGHFERDDTSPERLAADVTTRVRNVIHHHKFQPGAAELPQLQYLLFGKKSELFLAHLITRPPSFDHLLSVEVDDVPTDEELGRGIVVMLKDRPDTPAARIRLSSDTELTVTAEDGGKSRELRLRPKVEFYFEVGDLEHAM